MDKLSRDELFYKNIDTDKSALEMIDNIGNVNFQDSNGYSYLHVSAQSEFKEAIEKLLDKGADKAARANSNVSCIQLAEMQGLAL